MILSYLRNLFTLNWEASDVGICVPRNGWALMVLGCRLRCLQGPGEDNVFNHLGVLRTYSGTVLVSTGSHTRIASTARVPVSGLVIWA